jgi:hypothetical protein
MPATLDTTAEYFTNSKNKLLQNPKDIKSLVISEYQVAKWNITIGTNSSRKP